MLFANHPIYTDYDHSRFIG